MKNNSHYTLSISDLLMGFLFVFILILLKFMIDYHNKKDDLSKPLKERDILLESLKKQIEKKDIRAKIDKENGVLELPEILCFQKSKYKLNKEQKEGLKKIRKIFSKIICYSNLNSREMKKRWQLIYNKQFEKKKYCQSKKHDHKHGLIDTILVEGHADSTPVGENLCECEKDMFGLDIDCKCIRTNIDLSMERAKNVFKFLLQYREPTRQNPIPNGNYLYALVNKKNKSLFGVTSYGNLRSSDQRNNRKPDSSSEKERCINIRFIMSQSDDIQTHLKKKLKKGNQNE